MKIESRKNPFPRKIQFLQALSKIVNKIVSRASRIMTRSQILHSYRLSSLARDTLCNRPWASPPVKGSLSPPGSRISLTLIIVIIAHVPVVVVVPWPPPGRSITAMNHPGRKNKNDKREELLERIPFFALFNNLIVFPPLFSAQFRAMYGSSSNKSPPFPFSTCEFSSTRHAFFTLFHIRCPPSPFSGSGKRKFSSCSVFGARKRESP